jgi:hypothetical protein
MITDDVQRVLEQIFGADATPDIRPKPSAMAGSFGDVVAFAELLSRDASEEELQQFLTEQPQMLRGAMGYAQNLDLGFVTKPAIGTRYRADFAVLSYDQGGCDIHLIELERASAPLFTRKDTPAQRLQSAMGQVRDWDAWIRPNQRTFVRDLIDHAKTLPVLPKRHTNGSIIRVTPDHLEEAWRHFGGFDQPGIRYTIVIGRWGQLSEEHRKRLVYMNQRDGAVQQIRTFDQVARRSYSRPAISYY